MRGRINNLGLDYPNDGSWISSFSVSLNPYSHLLAPFWVLWVFDVIGGRVAVTKGAVCWGPKEGYSAA